MGRNSEDIGMELAAATLDIITEFVLTKLHKYEKDNFRDAELWSLFREDYEEFTASHFKNGLDNALRRRLQSTLRHRGVFISVQGTCAGATIGSTLEDVLKEETPHIWTDAEITEALAAAP